MTCIVTRLWRESEGEDLVEYGLLVAFAAAVVVAALIADPLGWRSALVTVFSSVVDALNIH